MSRPSGVWPARDDYQNAVRNPKRNVKDRRLQATQVETTHLGVLEVPFPRSGNFGAVYKFSNRHQAYALKVFDKAQPDRQLRYQLIHQHLSTQPKPPSLVSFSYDEQGILVNGRWYPALVMDWAEGQLLDEYLRETLNRHGQVDNRLLCQAWIELVLGLQQRRVAHGDLQHGNILVMPDGALNLVDYDGMFVPAMRQQGLTAAEIGLPAYQHPKRYRGYFDERLDNFAALVILLSLASLDGYLWHRYHTDDNCLVVREPDLLRPNQSALLTELTQSPDAPVRKLAVILKAAAQGGLDAIPPFADVVADGTIKQVLSPAWRPTSKKRPPPDEKKDELTPREQAVLGFVVQGYGDEEIANVLGIQEGTVRRHISRIQRKVGVFTRGDLINWAMAQGTQPTWQKPPEPPPPSPPPTPTPTPTPASSEEESGGGRAIITILAVIAVAVWFAWGQVKEFRAEQSRQATATVEAQIFEATATAGALAAAATVQAEETLVAQQSEATSIHDVWLEHNRLIEDTNSLAIHARFQVNRFDSDQVWVIARFWLSDGFQMDAPTSEYNIDGQAAIWDVADVIYEPTTYWDDFVLLIPTYALVEGQGHYATVEIRDRASNEYLDELETESFDYNP